MIVIKFSVNETDVIKIEQSDKLVSGNCEQIKCIFEFSQDYEGLDIRAVFNGEYRQVLNNECFAPELNEGECTIGVYAQKINDGVLEYRISPKPCSVFVYKGSYDAESVEAADSKAGELDIFVSQIKDMIKRSTGKSAYEIAVDNGFVGTESEWLESLKVETNNLINDLEDSATTTYSSNKIKELLSGISSLHFEFINTEEQLEALLETDNDGNYVNIAENTIYAIYNELLGYEEYDLDAYVEIFPMVREYEEGDSEFWLEVIGTVGNIHPEDFITGREFDTRFNAAIDEFNNKFQSKLKINNTFVGNGRYDCASISVEKGTELSFKTDIAGIYRLTIPTQPVVNDDWRTSIELCQNTEFRRGVVTELNISLPESMTDDFCSCIIFESGDTATSITAPAAIRFVGDDCSNGSFTPSANTGYEVSIRNRGSGRIIARVNSF